MQRLLFDFLFFSFGGTVGVIAMCILQAGRQSDRKMMELKGENLYNWFLSNAQSLVLMAIVVIGIYLGFKREFSKLIGFLVVALVAVGLVFNASGVKDVLSQFSIRLLEHKISIAIVRTFAYNKDRWKYYSRKEMFYMATKSANLYARIEPDVKEKAESILSTLGIPASSAINMFYKQIILQRGLPFEVKIPSARPVDISTLSEAEFNEELEKGYADMQAGRTKNAKKAFADIRKDYGL